MITCWSHFETICTGSHPGWPAATVGIGPPGCTRRGSQLVRIQRPRTRFLKKKKQWRWWEQHLPNICYWTTYQLFQTCRHFAPTTGHHYRLDTSRFFPYRHTTILLNCNQLLGSVNVNVFEIIYHIRCNARRPILHVPALCQRQNGHLNVLHNVRQCASLRCSAPSNGHTGFAWSAI